MARAAGLTPASSALFFSSSLTGLGSISLAFSIVYIAAVRCAILRRKAGPLFSSEAGVNWCTHNNKWPLTQYSRIDLFGERDPPVLLQKTPEYTRLGIRIRKQRVDPLQLGEVHRPIIGREVLCERMQVLHCRQVRGELTRLVDRAAEVKCRWPRLARHLRGHVHA